MIQTAIIPVAGWGTRRLPITKAIEKCMLPVGNRPIVDYAVEDCLRAGITDIYFVVSQGSSQLQAYYGHNADLEEYLRRQGKADLIPGIQPPDQVRFHYVTQPTAPDDAYGTAVPVALALEAVGDDRPVVVLMGDDLVYHQDDTSEVARLIAATQAPGAAACAILGVSVPHDQVSRYGVIDMDADRNFTQIIEKPTPDQAPSNFISVAKYVIDSVLAGYIRRYVATPRDEEYYITDPINDYVAAGGRMTVVPSSGQFLDSGTLEGWLEANRVVCASL